MNWFSLFPHRFTSFSSSIFIDFMLYEKVGYIIFTRAHKLDKDYSQTTVHYNVDVTKFLDQLLGVTSWLQLLQLVPTVKLVSATLFSAVMVTKQKLSFKVFYSRSAGSI